MFGLLIASVFLMDTSKTMHVCVCVCVRLIMSLYTLMHIFLIFSHLSIIHMYFSSHILGDYPNKSIYVYLWLIHIDVWQKPAQFCKAVIFQLKNK